MASTAALGTSRIATGAEATATVGWRRRFRFSTTTLEQFGLLAAVVAGLTFVVLQFVHPSGTLDSVTTGLWATVHYATIVMIVLFVIGIATLFAAQAEKAGWLGFIGLVVLSIGLIITGFGAVIEAFVYPVVVQSDPVFVQGFLGIVEGHPSSVDIGAYPAAYSLASACFLVGTVTFGVAMLRARVVPRLSAALFGFGFVLSGIVVAITGAYRLSALPIGFGLAWMGYSMWAANRRANAAEAAADAVPADVAAAEAAPAEAAASAIA